MNISEYKDVCVFIEQRENIIQKVSFELLGKARDLAEGLNEKVVAILLGGEKIGEKSKELVKYGADTVIYAEDENLKTYTTEAYTQAICAIIKENKPGIFLLGATTIGRDLGPRISARLKTGLTADCTKLEISENKEFLMTRPAFGGNLMATITCLNRRPQMSTVRPGVMKMREEDESRTGKIEKVNIDFDKSKFRVKILETVKQKKDMTNISDARILISGGRGIGNKDGFAKLRKLAAAMGDKVEVSASRAVVDSGVMDHERQVGQTGKTVRPELYIACGISGAIQHLAGMEESDFIIAINKDKYAPIFQVADLGIVGDAVKIIPLLTERFLKK